MFQRVDKIYYCKVHTPWEILTRYAEIHKMKMKPVSPYYSQAPRLYDWYIFLFQRDDKIYFCKVHAPWEILTRYAEILKMRMKNKPSSPYYSQAPRLYDWYIFLFQRDDKIYFCKVHAPWEILTRYAEILKMRMKMKPVSSY